MTIEIGNKSFSDLTADDIKQIILIEGCSPVPEHWSEPVIMDFNNTMFSDTVVADFVSYRKSDNMKSCEYTFFFNFKDFHIHYVRDLYVRDLEKNNPVYRPKGKSIKLETLKYLIKQGFDVPIY
jgi:hypothetical protein